MMGSSLNIQILDTPKLLIVNTRADPPPPPRKGKYRLPGRGIKASVGRGNSLPQSEIARIRNLAQQKN
jgi:hypothetical protein